VAGTPRQRVVHGLHGDARNLSRGVGNLNLCVGAVGNRPAEVLVVERLGDHYPAAWRVDYGRHDRFRGDLLAEPLAAYPILQMGRGIAHSLEPRQRGCEVVARLSDHPDDTGLEVVPTDGKHAALDKGKRRDEGTRVNEWSAALIGLGTAFTGPLLAQHLAATCSRILSDFSE